MFERSTTFTLILFIFAGCCNNVYARSQPNDTTGFYIILDENKRCASSFQYLHQKLTYCLSKRAFVTADDFMAISEIHYDTLKLSKFITVKISAKAFDRLHILVQKIPGIALALVIDGTIIGSFQNLGALTNPIPINSTLFSSDLEWIYARLKKNEHQK